ncbi:hypothetical protein B1964_23345 [Gordonia sp. i37]|nr:hypothetical protein B1964_23345 [Gordonia sp. i37]
MRIAGALLNLPVAEGFVVRIPDRSGLMLGPSASALVDVTRRKADVNDVVTFPLSAITSRTPTTRDALADQLAAVARDGFAPQVGEPDPDRACIAVGVRSPHGALTATLALSGRRPSRDHDAAGAGDDR